MIQTLFGSLDQPEKRSVFDRMRDAVTRTRETLNERIESVVALTREVDADALDELEAVLLSSDLGMSVTTTVLD